MIDKLQVLFDLYSAGDFESARKIAEDYIKEIDKIKAVEGRPKGKWKKGISHKYECSRCEQGADIESDYCAWCGADMRGNDDGI